MKGEDISTAKDSVTRVYCLSDTFLCVQTCRNFYFISDSVLTGSPRILSCHNMKLALIVSTTKNNIGFVFVLYFAIQVFLLEKCLNPLLH